MTKFKLKKDFQNRFEKFLSSNLFHNQAKYSKTSYWEYHSKEISYSINNSILTLRGKSGNYIPDRKNSYNFFLKSLKIFIKKIIGLSRSHNLSHKNAFEKVMNEKRDAENQKLCFDEKRIIAKNISDCKKNFTFDYVVNEHIIRSYYYLNILNSYIKLSETKYIAEIGGGNGNLILLLKHHFNSKCIINIDLPETLILSIPFIENLFPKAKILLPDEVNKKINRDTLSNYDFIFLTPNQINLLEENLIDLFINTSSFQEMNMAQIKEYIQLVQRVGKQNSFFYCSNRVEKTPTKPGENYKNVKTIKFSEYPFFNNEILFFETCKFNSLVSDVPCYLRLEKIKK